MGAGMVLLTEAKMAAAVSELLTGWCLFGVALLVRGGCPAAGLGRPRHTPLPLLRAGGTPAFPSGSPGRAGCSSFLGPSLFQLRASRLASSLGLCSPPSLPRQRALPCSSCRCRGGGAVGQSRAQS